MVTINILLLLLKNNKRFKMNNETKYIYTRHSIQRRINSEKYEIDYLKTSLDKLNNCFDFSSLKTGKYKITSKYRNKELKKIKILILFNINNKKELTLITFANFILNDFDIFKDKLNINLLENENKIDIYRYNFNNDKVKCGVILYKEEKYLIEFDKKIEFKYNNDFLHIKKVNTLEELEKNFIFNKKSNHYILQNLERSELKLKLQEKPRPYVYLINKEEIEVKVFYIQYINKNNQYIIHNKEFKKSFNKYFKKYRFKNLYSFEEINELLYFENNKLYIKTEYVY